MRLLPGKISDKILLIRQCRPTFYVVKLYVMTKTDGRYQNLMLKITNSTMCHDEPKFYIRLLHISVEYTSMRHKV